MRRSTLAPRRTLARARTCALLIAVASLLAGCETTGLGSASEAGKPGEPPKVEPQMTRSRAATECWMKAEKDSAGVNIDKRADIVTKCIDDKMKATAAAPKT